MDSVFGVPLIPGAPADQRRVVVDPSMADLTENGRIFAACAPLADMEPWQIVNFIRGIEHDAASRALRAAAAALRARRPSSPAAAIAVVDRMADRPDRLLAP